MGSAKVCASSHTLLLVGTIELLAVRGRKSLTLLNVYQNDGNTDSTNEDEDTTDDGEHQRGPVFRGPAGKHENQHQAAPLAVDVVDRLQFRDGTRGIAFNPHIHGEAVIASSKSLFRWDEAQGNAGVNALYHFPQSSTGASNRHERIRCQFGSHPRVVWLSNRRGLVSLDMRSVNVLARPSFSLDDGEASVDLLLPANRPFQLALATTSRVCLLDERFASRPVVCWDERHQSTVVPEWGALHLAAVQAARGKDDGALESGVHQPANDTRDPSVDVVPAQSTAGQDSHTLYQLQRTFDRVRQAVANFLVNPQDFHTGFDALTQQELSRILCECKDGAVGPSTMNEMLLAAIDSSKAEIADDQIIEAASAVARQNARYRLSSIPRLDWSTDKDESTDESTDAGKASTDTLGFKTQQLLVSHLQALFTTSARTGSTASSHDTVQLVGRLANNLWLAGNTLQRYSIANPAHDGRRQAFEASQNRELAANKADRRGSTANESDSQMDTFLWNTPGNDLQDSQDWTGTALATQEYLQQQHRKAAHRTPRKEIPSTQQDGDKTPSWTDKDVACLKHLRPTISSTQGHTQSKSSQSRSYGAVSAVAVSLLRTWQPSRPDTLLSVYRTDGGAAPASVAGRTTKPSQLATAASVIATQPHTQPPRLQFSQSQATIASAATSRPRTEPSGDQSQLLPSLAASAPLSQHSPRVIKSIGGDRAASQIASSSPLGTSRIASSLGAKRRKKPRTSGF
ncbi:hypothetical protein THASP1DRAFT_33152 [Thamnocephalis sphaerospora]|uniref:Uncharacterized protein n=1 Tax=Thamnocephalis sphaerospora TaxID=78915 RepID=A0A4P9XH88_9FUNG|nr:hypothetical protein THASP1DRAFT_33152 [Thamnocephalis sphaerospora]|eukprot:RKP05024.1 hypothetical protein THASP1DRAFT_33152 [Thamnocephalis sphaerospora]